MSGPSRIRRDEGAVLLLVMVVAIVLSLVVLALANFVAADLRYGRVVEARAQSLSTAQSGIDFAVSRLRNNQTLCATKVAGADAVALNGGAGSTLLPASLNESVTAITCQRLEAQHAAVGGWSAIVTANEGDALKQHANSSSFDKEITGGPVYVPALANVQVQAPMGSELWLRDSDIWSGSCSSSTPSGVVFVPAEIRGPICTTATWAALFDPPPVPDLSALDVLGDQPGELNGQLVGSCVVFGPGRYVGIPPIFASTTASQNVYFRSGNYVFDNVGEFLITGHKRVRVGHPGSMSVPSDACDGARIADSAPAGGPGATWYFDRSSHLRLDDGADLAMFARQQGDHFVSIHALPTSNPGGGDRSLVRTRTLHHVDLVVHGLIWSPASRVVIDNFYNSGPTESSQQWLLGGVVTEKLWIGDAWTGGSGALDSFRLEPAEAASDATILLCSTSTIDGVTSTVEATVQYRPQASNPDQRVGINSSYVVDECVP